MSHEPRLTGELRALLSTQRMAALGTLTDEGAPLVSMVPFAIERTLGCLVIHVSALAAHTQPSRSVTCLAVGDGAGEARLACA